MSYIDLAAKIAIEALTTRIAALEAASGGSERLVVSAVAAAEALDVIEVTITCVDQDDESVAGAVVQIDLVDADLDLAIGADQAFDVTTGTALSSDMPGSNVQQLVQASGGSIVIDVTDKSASLAGSMYLRLTPINQVGPVKLFEVTFA